MRFTGPGTADSPIHSGSYFLPKQGTWKQVAAALGERRRGQSSVTLLAFRSRCSNRAAVAPGIVSVFKAGRGRGRAGAGRICPFYQESEHIPGNPAAWLAPSCKGAFQLLNRQGESQRLGAAQLRKCTAFGILKSPVLPPVFAPK